MSQNLSGPNQNNEIARLRGIRFVVLQEPNENERLQVGKMKEMTGGDKIVCRHLNASCFEYKPTISQRKVFTLYSKHEIKYCAVLTNVPCKAPSSQSKSGRCLACL